MDISVNTPMNASMALLSTFLVKILNSPKRLLQQMENMTTMKRKWKKGRKMQRGLEWIYEVCRIHKSGETSQRFLLQFNQLPK